MEPITLQYYGGPGFTWLEDGQRFYTVVADRGYTQRQVRVVDAATGAVHVAVDERGDPFVDTSRGFMLRFLKSGEALWADERDGWMHLYLHDGATGQLKRQITKGEWVVRAIARVDEAARAVFFSAGGKEPGRDPYLQHLYRVSLDGTGLRLLTPEDAEHQVSFSPTGAFFVDTYSRADLPAVSVLRRAADGSVVMELERADVSRLVASGWKQPEPFQAVARDGKTDIYGIVWRPSTFDPGKRYPVVEQIYTGPQSFFVPKSFSAWRNHAQTIAELGFIVVQVDGFGTAWRSRAFHATAWKNLGDQGLEDHIGALKQLAAKHAYIDLSRVGIYGHSAGGYDATHALLTHPEFYQVGVSSSGNHDHRLDKAWWNTQWMGWPVGPHYDAQSNVTLARNLEGKLLLAHGDMDDNVPISATLRLVDALIKAEKDFDLIVIPNGTHGIGGNPYFIRRRWDFFVRHLLGVEPPGHSVTP
jgi:dipeptidyl aminopeptidase/acylaminoacyl peptidase